MTKIKLYLLILIFINCSNNNTKSSLLPEYNGKNVVDFANVINKNDSILINNICDNIYLENSIQIVLCTMDSIQKFNKKYNNFLNYCTNLFNYWELKKKGILFLISIEDRKVAICTGYLIEDLLPDSACGRIINNNMIPNLKNKEYGKACINDG